MKNKLWTAIIINLLFAGAGYLYIGQRKKLGISMLFAYILCNILFLWDFVTTPTMKGNFLALIITIISLQSTIHVYYLAKKKFEPVKKQTQKKKWLKRIAIFLFLTTLSVDLFLISFMVNLALQTIVFNNVTRSVQTVNPFLYITIAYITGVLQILSLYSVPIFQQRLYSKKPPVIRTILSIVGLNILFLGLLIGNGILLFSHIKSDPIAKEEYNSKQVWEAVNTRRGEYGREPLIMNKWACEVADKRLADNLKVGNGYLITNEDKFISAIEETVNKYQHASAKEQKEPMPEFANEFIFISPNLEDGINVLDEGETKSLYRDANFTYGCAAAGKGYAVIITSYDPLYVPPEEVLEI